MKNNELYNYIRDNAEQLEAEEISGKNAYRLFVGKTEIEYGWAEVEIYAGHTDIVWYCKDVSNPDRRKNFPIKILEREIEKMGRVV
jgi:hypothetical protein